MAVMTGGMWAFTALAVIGVILVVVGGVLIPVFHKIVHEKVEEGVKLKNDSDAFRTWRDPPATVYMSFYVYDVINRQEVLFNGSKPVLVQRGPYVYREIRTKEKVGFRNNDTLLTYMETKSYVFVASKSNGTQTDTFSGLNLALVKVMSYVDRFSSWLQTAAKYAIELTGERLLEEYGVEAYLFGYEDRVLKEFKKFCEDLFKNCSIIDDRVGLFIQTTGNGTADGTYVIHTGSDDVKTVNEIETWNGNRSLDFWKTSYCNMINGTVGTMWHPYMHSDEKLYLFSSDICRSIYLTESSSYTLEKKIHVKRFTPPASVFADPKDNPDNRGFCPGKCLKAGVIDLRNCKDGVPVVMSLPHFFEGDKEYQTDVIGLKPDENLHQTVIDIEPYTGAAFNVKKRLQINLRITHSTVVPASLKLKDGIIFPVVWLEEGATINKAGIDKFVKAVYNPMKMTAAIHWGIMGLGILLLLVAIVILIVIIVRRRGKEDPEFSGLITPEDEGDQ